MKCDTKILLFETIRDGFPSGKIVLPTRLEAWLVIFPQKVNVVGDERLCMAKTH